MLNYNNIFKSLNSDNYYVVKKQINELINNDEFLNKITFIANPFIFDRFTKMAQYKMDTSKLCEERNKYLKKTILNNSERVDDRWLTEYIISYFFQDNYYNFMTNVFQMVRYLGSINKDLISSDNLKIYKEFVNLNKLSYTEKQDLFKKYYQKDNLMEMFYDDISTVRDDSHLMLVKSTLKLNKKSSIYQWDLSRRIGVDVYYLTGEPFYGFVRSLSIKRGDLSDHSDYVFSNKNQLGYSFSFVGDKNTGTIDYDKKSVLLYYDSINSKNIMYVHHTDLHAKKMTVQDDYLSEKENEILLPKDLVSKTKNYNEIYVKGDKNGIKPSAVVCYDRITNYDIAFAEKYGLGILLIDSRNYKSYETFDEDYEENTYIL